MRIQLCAVIVAVTCFTGAALGDEPAAGKRASAKASIKIYGQADQAAATASSPQAADKVKLTSEPWLTEEDIYYYDQPTCCLYFKAKALQEWFFASKYGTGSYVVVVDGQPRIQCRIDVEGMAEYFGSMRTAHPESELATDRLPGIAVAHLLSPWINESDVRDDPSFLAALAKNGQLDRESFPKPHLTTEQVIAAARRDPTGPRVVHPAQSPGRQIIPDSWPARSVRYCRDVYVSQPSMNRSTVESLPPLHGVWLVEFNVPEKVEKEQSQLVQSGREGDDPKHLWRIVEDATGQATDVLYVVAARCLPAPGAEESSVGPNAAWAQVQESALASTKSLARADRGTFLVSAEYAFGSPEHAQWARISNVWLCEGRDTSDASVQFLVAATGQYRDGLHLAVTGPGLKLRRAVPAVEVAK